MTPILEHDGVTHPKKKKKVKNKSRTLLRIKYQHFNTAQTAWKKKITESLNIPKASEL